MSSNPLGIIIGYDSVNGAPIYEGGAEGPPIPGNVPSSGTTPADSGDGFNLAALGTFLGALGTTASTIYKNVNSGTPVQLPGGGGVLYNNRILAGTSTNQNWTVIALIIAAIVGAILIFKPRR